MKKLFIIYVIAASIGFSSCTGLFGEGQLDMAPVEDINEDKIFSDYAMFRQYADQTYSYMPGHLGRLWNSLVSSMGDESRNKGGCTAIFNNGAWDGTQMESSNKMFDANNEISTMWQNMYIGIRKTNKIIENIDRIPNFPSQEIRDRCLGEAYFLRAFFYFELIKRWGGVPIIDHTLTLNKDNLDLPRDTYEKCVEFIVNDCNTAANGLLPLKYADADNGRASVGAAKALKSRVLLYAARPLHNPSNDITKWEKATKAAKDVIDLKLYTLYPDYVNMFFQPVCSEIIMNRPRIKMNFEQGHTNGSTFWTRFIATQGYDGWAGEWVTQNMVDMFEDSKGYPITNSKIYKDEDPYANRDPRLDMCVLRNDRFWYNRKLEFWVSANGKETGRDKGTTHINVLGYAIAKFWPEAHQRYKGTSTYMNYIFFRYAEILLNFAEAQNEVGGPESSLEGLSVRDVLTELRGRVGQVPVPTDISDTKEKMRERIYNERSVELCFEEHRWYDVLSWHKGVEYFNKDIYGIRVVKNTDGTFTYSREKYETPTFKEHMHLYPIPNNEVYKSAVLEQNPGWK